MSENICLLANLCDERELSSFPFGTALFLLWGKNPVVLIMGLWPCESAADGLLWLQLTAGGFAQSTSSLSLLPWMIQLLLLQTTNHFGCFLESVDEILQTPPLSSTATLVGASHSFLLTLRSVGLLLNLLVLDSSERVQPEVYNQHSRWRFARWSDPSQLSTV